MGVEVQLHACLTSALEGDGWSTPLAKAALLPSTRFARCWVGPWTGLDGRGGRQMFCFHSAASRFTDCSVLVRSSITVCVSIFTDVLEKLRFCHISESLYFKAPDGILPYLDFIEVQMNQIHFRISVCPEVFLGRTIFLSFILDLPRTLFLTGYSMWLPRVFHAWNIRRPSNSASMQNNSFAWYVAILCRCCIHLSRYGTGNLNDDVIGNSVTHTSFRFEVTFFPSPQRNYRVIVVVFYALSEVQFAGRCGSQSLVLSRGTQSFP